RKRRQLNNRPKCCRTKVFVRRRKQPTPKRKWFRISSKRKKLRKQSAKALRSRKSWAWKLPASREIWKTNRARVVSSKGAAEARLMKTWTRNRVVVPGMAITAAADRKMAGAALVGLGWADPNPLFRISSNGARKCSYKSSKKASAPKARP